MATNGIFGVQDDVLYTNNTRYRMFEWTFLENSIQMSSSYKFRRSRWKLDYYSSLCGKVTDVDSAVVSQADMLLLQHNMCNWNTENRPITPQLW